MATGLLLHSPLGQLQPCCCSKRVIIITYCIGWGNVEETTWSRQTGQVPMPKHVFFFQLSIDCITFCCKAASCMCNFNRLRMTAHCCNNAFTHLYICRNTSIRLAFPMLDQMMVIPSLPLLIINARTVRHWKHQPLTLNRVFNQTIL